MECDLFRLFICMIYIDVGSTLDCTAQSDWIAVNNELKDVGGRHRRRYFLIYSPGICLDVFGRTMNNLRIVGIPAQI
jgi:hypothetical protein